MDTLYAVLYFYFKHMQRSIMHALPNILFISHLCVNLYLYFSHNDGHTEQRQMDKIVLFSVILCINDIKP